MREIRHLPKECSLTITNWQEPSQVKAYLDDGLRADLEALARRNDRSMAGEIRRALRRHVATHRNDEAGVGEPQEDLRPAKRASDAVAR